MAPKFLILDTEEDIEQFLRELALTGNHELFSPETVQGYIVQMLDHLHDKQFQDRYAQAFIGDCVEVFVNDIERSGNAEESNTATLLRIALQNLWFALFRKLDQAKAYDDNNVLHYAFYTFLGRDIVLQYLPHE